MLKNCKKCTVEKPRTDFHKHHGVAGGYPHCKACVSDINKAWREANPGIRKPYMKLWYGEHKENRRNYNLVQNYGITLEEYSRMLEAQAGVCAICKQPPSKKNNHAMSLHIDHCHTTGRIRGLLCNKCNSGIGFFQESEELVTKAANYLKVKEN